MSNVPLLYTYDPHTQEYKGSRLAQVVGGKALTRSAFATTLAPPTDIPVGSVAVWTGDAWEITEDHRPVIGDSGTKSGGTAYWLPAKGDDYTSPARYMEKPGPLPKDAVRKRPEQPLADVKAAKVASILTGHEAALAGAVALSDPTPSTVAVEAGLLAASDPEGLEYVRNALAAHRDALLAAVEAADTAEVVQAIVVSYAV